MSESNAADGLSIGDSDRVTLVVGWTVNGKSRMRPLLLGPDVRNEFIEIAQNATEDLQSRESAEWTPDADLSPETYLVFPASDANESPVLATEHDGKRFLQVLAEAETLDAVDPNAIPAANMSFYAIVVGKPGDRAAFVRRSNPQRGLRTGKLFGALRDSLQKIDEPILAFDRWVDLILYKDDLYVFSQTVFAAFFRDQEHLAKKIPEWVDQLEAHVPISKNSRKHILDKVTRDTRLKARLEAIVRRDHLSSVSTETLRKAMVSNGLDPERLLGDDGKLSLEEEDVSSVLYLLNEDLFTGSLTNSGFRADKKAAR